MDSAVVRAKLEGLRRSVQRVRDNAPYSAEVLAQDEDLQDIISVNLERAVQVCVDIAAHLIAESEGVPPQTMGESFETLSRMGVIPKPLASQLRKAVGFRNISVHAYQPVDWDIVYAIVTTRLDDFRDFAARVSARLEAG